jgi:NAD(P)-dependent dehydrogenase (short-subunit alcohol dehydrogenase family)
MALNYAQYDIRVNCLSPGCVLPECQLEWYQNPKARAAAETIPTSPGSASPEDIAELARFLAGDRGEFFTGSNLVIDGGFTAFKSQLPPGELFRTE